jgi:hypothetical protein
MSVAAPAIKPTSKRSSGRRQSVELGRQQHLGDVRAFKDHGHERLGARSQGVDSYEVSDPRRRLPIDRADAPTPEGDAKLSVELRALRSSPGLVARSGGTTGAGNGLNGGGTRLRSAGGRIPPSDWDHPERIVGRLTQTPARGGGTNSEYRCGPANLLAASLMQGPASGARFLEGVAREAGSAQLNARQRGELRTIAGRVRDRTATFEDLSRAQGLLYRAGNTESTAQGLADTLATSRRLTAGERRQARQISQAMRQPGFALSQPQGRLLERLGTKHHGQPTRLTLMQDEHRPADRSADYWGVRVGGTASATDRSGFNDRELAGLGAMGGSASASGPQVNRAAHHPLEDMVSRLQPGQSATVRVHHEAITDANAASARADHFVTVGRRRDGTPYLYNSDPGRGDHTLFVGRPGQRQPENFVAELRRYDDRMALDGDFDTPHTVTRSW